MKKWTSALLLLCASSAAAQTPIAIQTCAIVQVAGQQGSYSCTFVNPVKAGDTIVFPEVGAVASIADSQGGTWTNDVAKPQLAFWHELNAKGGQTTETVKMTSPEALNGVFAEYPPATGVQTSPIASGGGTTPLSFSLAAPAGSIAIGFGSQWTNSWQGPSAAGAGFTLESPGGLWFEDKQISAAGNITASATYSAPMYWFAGAAVLSIGPPPPFVWQMPGLGTATFPMNIPPACGPSDGTCSIQIQVCDTSKTPPVCMTSSQGTITLLKNITLPAPQQQSIPLVTVTP